MKECCLDGKVFVHSQALNCFRKSIGILPNGAPIDTSKKSGGERNSWNENIGGARGFLLVQRFIRNVTTGLRPVMCCEISTRIWIVMMTLIWKIGISMMMTMKIWMTNWNLMIWRMNIVQMK